MGFPPVIDEKALEQGFLTWGHAAPFFGLLGLYAGWRFTVAWYELTDPQPTRRHHETDNTEH